MFQYGFTDDSILFTWDRSGYHLEIELFTDGHIELFYWDKINDVMIGV